MTWKYKLPEPPRTQYTAREVAVSIGVSVQDVMDALKVLGEFVTSPARKCIEEPVKRKVCDHLGVDYQPPAVHTPAPWRTRDPGRPRRDRSVRGRPASAGPKDSGTRTLKTPDRSVGLGDPVDDVSVTMEDFSWTYYGFTHVDRDAWCVYLRRGQAKYAAQLRDAGFMPDDLGVTVGGWTVYKRLREGESIAGVKRLLDRSRRSETG